MLFCFVNRHECFMSAMFHSPRRLPTPIRSAVSYPSRGSCASLKSTELSPTAIILWSKSNSVANGHLQHVRVNLPDCPCLHASRAPYPTPPVSPPLRCPHPLCFPIPIVSPPLCDIVILAGTSRPTRGSHSGWVGHDSMMFRGG